MSLTFVTVSRVQECYNVKNPAAPDWNYILENHLGNKYVRVAGIAMREISLSSSNSSII
jgi:hypothetical protein